MRGSFSAQAADLRCVWPAYQRRHLFRRLGDLKVSDFGFVYLVGAHTVAMCQCRDNRLVATDAPQGAWADLVEQIRYVLQTAWGLPVVCECVTDTQDYCMGQCRGPICKPMGMVMMCGLTEAGLAFAETAALTASWDLKLGPPPLSTERAYHGYLGAIFTGMFRNGLPFTDSWAAQILSAAAWLRVAMISGYGPEAMRAMHKGTYRAYATGSHDVQATVKAVYSVSYLLPAARHTVAQHISNAPLPRPSRPASRARCRRGRWCFFSLEGGRGVVPKKQQGAPTAAGSAGVVASCCKGRWCVFDDRMD